MDNWPVLCYVGEILKKARNRLTISDTAQTEEDEDW